jgi:hypothetical protein
MEETGGGEIANRPVVGIDLEELGRSAALGYFPKQLVLRESVGMGFEDAVQNRRLQLIVFFVVEVERPAGARVRRFLISHGEVRLLVVRPSVGVTSAAGGRLFLVARYFALPARS